MVRLSELVLTKRGQTLYATADRAMREYNRARIAAALGCYSAAIEATDRARRAHSEIFHLDRWEYDSVPKQDWRLLTPWMRPLWGWHSFRLELSQLEDRVNQRILSRPGRGVTRP